MITKVLSGGQAGADRGALNFCIKHGIPHGGWCPKGRRAEDGPIPLIYNLQETESSQYPPRTIKNIQESDVTIIFTPQKVGHGSQLTLTTCINAHKPYFHVRVDADSLIPWAMQLQKLADWLEMRWPSIVNVAGSRESSSPGIIMAVEAALDFVLTSKPHLFHAKLK
jgi:hypothetical protein